MFTFDGNLSTTFKFIVKTFGLLFCGHGVQKIDLITCSLTHLAQATQNVQ